jgi:hypothetical protein
MVYFDDLGLFWGNPVETRVILALLIRLRDSGSLLTLLMKP